MFTNETILRAALATGIALIGGGVGAFAGGDRGRKNLVPLVAVSGGALLAVGLFAVLPEAAQQMGAWWKALFAAATGYALFSLIGRYVYPVCPACAATHDHDDEEEGEHEETDSSKGVRNASHLLALVLTLHAFVDGMAVSQDGGVRATMPILLAILLHKLPEGLALSALLRASGRTAKSAFGVTALIEMATLAGGAFGGAFFALAPLEWRGAMLAHLAGGFIYLVFHGFWGDLIAPSIGFARRITPQIRYGTIGFGAVSALLYLLPH